MMNRYDAGKLDAIVEVTEVILEQKWASNILVYPEVACYMTLDGSPKEIYLPALAWTPISVATAKFSIRAIEEIGKVYWQVWYI